MKIDLFMQLWRFREMSLNVKFAEKHQQYGTDEDVFLNNIAAAKLAGLAPEAYLMANVAKHVAVLAGRAAMLTDGDPRISEREMAMYRESMDDTSVWMFILNGLLEERFQRGLAENGP